MSGRKRILIIENSRQVTGALKSICAMANDLSGDFDFIFILPSGSAATNWLRAHSSFKVFEVRMMELSKSFRSILYIPSLFISAFQVKRIIKKEKIDVVHSNDLYNLIGPLLSSLGAKFRYLCHVRFMPDGFPPWLYYYWLARQLGAAENVIVVSDVLKSRLRNDPKIIRIYDRMMLPSRDQVDSKRSGNTILYLSNIIPGKGHDYAIAAFAIAAKRFPSWKLKIAGSDMNLEKNRRYRETLKEQSVLLGVDHLIDWNDFVDNVSSLYLSADIFANFSSSESFSMTCLEAQYFGCCVVATRSGGPSEIVIDGTSGLLVPVGDVEAMARALEKLMDNPQLRHSMGSSGAANVREKFGPDRTSDNLKAIYLQS